MKNKTGGKFVRLFTVSFLIFEMVVGEKILWAASASAVPMDTHIFVNVSKKVVPSVVNISTLSTPKGYPSGRGGPGGTPDDLFRKFFEDFFRQRGGGDGMPDSEGDDDAPAPKAPPGKGGPKGGRPGPRAMALGTGFVIDSSGLIITNNHVVADADEIKISFTEAQDEKPTDGEVVGRDPEIDLALIRVKTKRTLVPAQLGDSDALEVGEMVVAIGNPFGQGHSVSHGIVSAKGRIAPDFPLARYIQTDAPINPGNSGGPLVNLKGEVIGINNAIDARAQGIGFAIPISEVKKALPQLKTKGTVARGYIGVLVEPLTAEIAGKIGVSKDLNAPFVTNVYKGEPADLAGIQSYDVITQFNEKKITSPADLIEAVTSVNVGETAKLTIIRGREEKVLSIKIAERPSNKKMQGKVVPPAKKPKAHPKVDSGMTLDELTPQSAREWGLPEKTKGVVVSGISYGGPADRAGLMRGDVILEVDRKPVPTVEAFYSAVTEKKSYLLRVQRSDASGREGFAVILLDLKD